MVDILRQLGVSLIFLVLNVIILRIVLEQNRSKKNRKTDGNPEDPAEAALVMPREKGLLSASEILGWEFEYARITASEAMQERHTLVNFYLLIAGVVTSGVVAVLGQDTDLPYTVGTVLMWMLCIIGWIYLLALIRLRQAWHESATTMNQIKDFYIQRSKEFAPEILSTAFRWQSPTLPDPDKWWTVYFYSATLIGLVNSAAYVAGGVLLDLANTRSWPLPVIVFLALFGLAYFIFHVRMYRAFLKKEKPSTDSVPTVQSTR